MPHRRRHGVGARRSRPGPDAREDPGRSQQERDSDAVQHRRTLPVADRQASRHGRLLTESSPPRCMAGASQAAATERKRARFRAAHASISWGREAATEAALCALRQRRAPLVLGQDMRGFSANTPPLASVLSCRGQASNPILALRGEGRTRTPRADLAAPVPFGFYRMPPVARPLARIPLGEAS